MINTEMKYENNYFRMTASPSGNINVSYFKPLYIDKNLAIEFLTRVNEEVISKYIYSVFDKLTLINVGTALLSIIDFYIHHKYLRFKEELNPIYFDEKGILKENSGLIEFL